MKLKINLKRGPWMVVGRLGIFCGVKKHGGAQQFKFVRIPKVPHFPGQTYPVAPGKSGGYVAFLGPIQVFWFPALLNG